MHGQRSRGLKSRRAGSCNFPTDRWNFRQKRLWLLKILILPLNFAKIGVFCPKFSIFGRKIFDNDNSFRQFSEPKIWGIIAVSPLPPLPRRHYVYRGHMIWFQSHTLLKRIMRYRNIESYIVRCAI